MKLLLHPAVTALGLSVLYCLGIMGPFLSPDHLWIYHDSGSPSAVFVPVLFDTALLWAVFAVSLRLQRKHRRIGVIVWSSLVLATPWLILEDGSLLGAWAFPHRLSVTILLASALCWLAVTVATLSVPSFLPLFKHVQTVANTILGFAALSAIMTVGQLLWFFWQARAIQSPRPLHQPAIASAARTPKPRIVWIILDELSYQQVYEHRFASLDLPAFDQLAAQSTVFTNVAPAAEFTEDAVPSLMTGYPVDTVHSSADGASLTIHNPSTGQWQPFHPQDTIFQDALDDGYSTAIAGWFNPYCRLLPQVLDRCIWSFKASYDLGMSGNSSVLSNIVTPWLRAVDLVVLPDRGKRQAASWMNRDHLQDARDLSAATDRLIADPSVDFLLLHMPFPHPGAIYDRRKSASSTYGASYLDNLVFADRYLAHVRQQLTDRGEWDSATILVMGDHSWRTTQIWASSSFWTPEDQAASHGGEYDPRPAYLVKLPHQTQPALIQSPFAATRTRALLDGILSGAIRSPSDLGTFAHARK